MAQEQGKVFEGLVEQINSYIQEKGLKPNDKLPSERTLAATFGVSRNSVREATQHMERYGLLIRKQRSGTFIAPNYKSGKLDHYFDKCFADSMGKIREVIELRMLLAPSVAAVAAEKISDYTLSELEDLLERMKALPEKSNDLMVLDMEFHMLICKAIGNSVLTEMTEKIIFHFASACQVPNLLELDTQILEGLRAHDPHVTGNAMSQYVASIQFKLSSP